MSQVLPTPIPPKPEPRVKGRGLRRTPLRKASKQRQAELRVYASLKRYWHSLNPYCGFQVCCKPSMPSPHHKMGQGKYLNRVETWMPVCMEHHQWIEDHKNKARELGYILYRR